MKPALILLDGTALAAAQPAPSGIITAEDVARMARKYPPYDNVQVTAVADGGRVRELPRKFGPVEEKPVD